MIGVVVEQEVSVSDRGNEGRPREKDMALRPVREQSVDFQGDGIPVAQADDGGLYVALRPITDHLGLAFGSQRLRVLRDRILAPRTRTLLMTAADGRQRDLLCIPLDLLPGYLFGITTGRVRPELVDKLDRYRADCFRVLWQAFKGGADTTDARSIATGTEMDSAPSGAALALEIATAVQHLARQQLEMEQRLADVAGTQTVMADYVRGFIIETNHRLTALERATATEATITEVQAAEVSLAVKAVGQALQAAGNREGYAQVYSALYRRYRVSAYKSLPARSYEEVMDWLHRWYLEAAPPEAPGGAASGEGL